MNNKANTNEVIKKYTKGSIWVLSGLTLVALIVMSVTYDMYLLTPVVVSVVFSFITMALYVKVWQKIANKTPNVLTKFYLSAPAIRMLLAAIVVLVYCLVVKEKTAILNFVIVFFVYYISTILFESIFFARLEKSKTK